MEFDSAATVFPLIVKHSNWINIQGRILLRYILRLKFQLSHLHYNTKQGRKGNKQGNPVMKFCEVVHKSICCQGGKSSTEKTVCRNMIIAVQLSRAVLLLVKIFVKAFQPTRVKRRRSQLKISFLGNCWGKNIFARIMSYAKC